MSLLPIARALGGEAYDCGRRAVVPGPGHSPSDRSVSLYISNGRILIHSFGRSSWREVLTALRARGLIDAAGRPSSGSGEGWSSAHPTPSSSQRVGVARRLWEEAAPITRQLSAHHIRRRGVLRAPPVSGALRHHPSVPTAVYADLGARRPALLAAVTTAENVLCAVEVTYLAPNGERANDLRVSRKIVGVLPPSCAVRLDAVREDLLVGEGVFSTLSASARFALPGWALLSTGNLRTWSPPSGVRRVLIAADRGLDGERSARCLRRHLGASGVIAHIAWPPLPASDWNEAWPKTEEGED